MRTAIAVAITALLVGGASATAGSLITSSAIKDNTIQSKDVRNGTLRLRDLNASDRTKLLFPLRAKIDDVDRRLNELLAAHNTQVANSQQGFRLALDAITSTNTSVANLRTAHLALADFVDNLDEACWSANEGPNC